MGFALDDGLKPVEVYRLCQVLFETGVQTGLNILLHAETAERYPCDRAFSKLTHDVQSASVGQTDVADQQVEAGDVGSFQCGLERGGCCHLVPKCAQQAGENTKGEHDHGQTAQRGVGLDAPADLIAGQAFHDQIEQNGLDAAGVKNFKRLNAGWREDRVEAFVAQLFR